MSFWVILGLSRRRPSRSTISTPLSKLLGHDVPVMEEGVLLEADVHEGGFEAVFEVAHLALEDAADQAFLGGALDVELLEPAFLEHGDAGFERFGVDDDFLVDPLDRLDQPLDLLDQVGGRGADGLDDAPGLFLDAGRARTASLPRPRPASPGWARGNRACRRGGCVGSAGSPSGGRPAAMFSARSISWACRCSYTFSWARVVRRRLPRGPGWRRGRAVAAAHVPARRWGGIACRAGAGRNFCHS